MLIKQRRNKMNKEEVKQMEKEAQQKADEWIKTEEESGDIVQRVKVAAYCHEDYTAIKEAFCSLGKLLKTIDSKPLSEKDRLILEIVASNLDPQY